MAEPLVISFAADTSRAQGAMATLASQIVGNMATIGVAMSGGAANSNTFGASLQGLANNAQRAAAAIGQDVSLDRVRHRQRGHRRQGHPGGRRPRLYGRGRRLEHRRRGRAHRPVGHHLDHRGRGRARSHRSTPCWRRSSASRPPSSCSTAWRPRSRRRARISRISSGSAARPRRAGSRRLLPARHPRCGEVRPDGRAGHRRAPARPGGERGPDRRGPGRREQRGRSTRA